MQALFNYSLQHPHISPPEALRELVTIFGQQQQVLSQSQQAPHGQVQRTPSVNGPPPQFSPAAAQLGMPPVQGSPHVGAPTHTPSPAQNPMAGPVAMAHQQSQQGTNTSASGASANASPNVGNKRRRTSTVKLEPDDPTPGNEVNGNVAQNNAQKVKASPRVPKRQKGATS